MVRNFLSQGVGAMNQIPVVIQSPVICLKTVSQTNQLLPARLCLYDGQCRPIHRRCRVRHLRQAHVTISRSLTCTPTQNRRQGCCQLSAITSSRVIMAARMDIKESNLSFKLSGTEDTFG